MIVTLSNNHAAIKAPVNRVIAVFFWMFRKQGGGPARPAIAVGSWLPMGSQPRTFPALEWNCGGYR